MAIWQFDLSFIRRLGPRPRRTEDGHEVPTLSAEESTAADIWLRGRFGTPREMIEGFLVFGEEKGCRFDLLLNDVEGEGAELSVRIDARAETDGFIREVCELASGLGCVLFSAESWREVEPVPSEVTHFLKASRAAAFVQDPYKSIVGRGT